MNLVPHNEDYEKAIIAGILSDPSLLPRIGQIVSPNDFYKHSAREIMEVINEIGSDNLDSLAVEDRLTNDNTKVYFKQLVKDSDAILPSLSNIIFYAETVKKKSQLRAGIALGQEMASVCFQDNVDSDEALQQIEEMFATFLSKRVQDNKFESTKEAFQTFLSKLGTRVQDDEGTKTGFKAIDLILHRLEGLIVLAAKTSVGKTGLAINIARNVAETQPVVFFSLEQTQEQIFERILAAEAEVSLEDIRTGAFIADSDSVSRVDAAKSLLLPIFDRIHVDERDAIPTSAIASVARQKRFEWGELGLIVVDYLHILRLGDRNLVDALGDATKQLRALGKELGCPVLLLSQLSRQPEMVSGGEGEGKVRRRPELSDLRSSGEIEQVADTVIFLYRDSYYDQTGYIPDEDDVEVIIKKNRQGRTGITSLIWTPKYIKFRDPTY